MTWNKRYTRRRRRRTTTKKYEEHEQVCNPFNRTKSIIFDFFNSLTSYHCLPYQKSFMNESNEKHGIYSFPKTNLFLFTFWVCSLVQSIWKTNIFHFICSQTNLIFLTCSFPTNKHHITTHSLSISSCSS